MNNDNPFYDNHVFTHLDFGRRKLSFLDKLSVFFRPMYVQVDEGYTFYYKVKGSQYFLFKREKNDPS